MSDWYEQKYKWKKAVNVTSKIVTYDTQCIYFQVHLPTSGETNTTQANSSIQELHGVYLEQMLQN